MTLVLPLSTYTSGLQLPDWGPPSSHSTTGTQTTRPHQQFIPTPQSPTRAAPVDCTASSLSHKSAWPSDARTEHSLEPDGSGVENRYSSTANNMGHKRKLLLLEDLTECSRPKRMSPFLNTPKQKREDKRKILKISIHKLRQINDPEVFLRRSVLINNTMKKMQTELREEKYYPYHREKYPGIHGAGEDGVTHRNGPPRKRLHCAAEGDQERVPTTPSSPAYMHLFDELPLHFVNERITDDMTDTIVRTVIGLDCNGCSNCNNNNNNNNISSCCGKMETSCQTDDTKSHGHCLVEPNNNIKSTTTDSLKCDSNSYHEQSLQPTTQMECSLEFTCDLNDEKYVNVTEKDRQILGEMDAVFNNLISVLTEA